MTLADVIFLARRSYLDDWPKEQPIDWKSDDSRLRWKNDELTDLCNEARRELCKTHPIRDSQTAAVCEVAVVAGTAIYSYPSDRVLSITSAKLDLEDYGIGKVDTHWLDENKPSWRQGNQGTPSHFIVDNDTRNIMLVPTPDTADTLRLSVERYPLVDLDWNADQDVEIPEARPEFHSALAHWIAYKAFMKQDADTSRKFSAQHYSEWVQRVGNQLTAQQLRSRDLLGGRRLRTFTRQR